MLDVARHFFPVETVKAYIDRAAGLKFNALHLHLTDDQGWRIHLDSRPKLTEPASGTAVGGDAGRLLLEGRLPRDRRVRGIPPHDRGPRGRPARPHARRRPRLPRAGRGARALGAHPRDRERTAARCRPPGSPTRAWAVGFSSLRIHDEATYDFVADVVGELAAMTPGSVPAHRRRRGARHDPDDFAVFMERATAIVADLGKTPITWHEAGAAASIDPSTVGQYWGFTTPTDGMDEKARDVRRATTRGVILSPADAVYLDMKYDADSPLGLTWANGPTSVERAYSWEPAAVIDGVDGCRHPRRRGADVDRDDPHARRHRRDGVPAHRGGGRGGLVARDPAERSAHLGVVPRPGRRRSVRSGRASASGFHRSPEIPWAPGSTRVSDDRHPLRPARGCRAHRRGRLGALRRRPRRRRPASGDGWRDARAARRRRRRRRRDRGCRRPPDARVHRHPRSRRRRRVRTTTAPMRSARPVRCTARTAPRGRWSRS